MRLTSYENGLDREMVCRHEDCHTSEEHCPHINECECGCLQEVLEKLAHYEDLEEQGKLMELPYEVGICEYIYYADEKDSEVYKLDADEIHISRMPVSNRFLFTIDGFEFYLEDFGKIVFLTKEEAEAKLKDLEGDHFTDVNKMGKE